MEKLKRMLHDWLNSDCVDGKEHYYRDMDDILKKKVMMSMVTAAILFAAAILSIPVVWSLNVFVMLFALSILTVIFTLIRLKDIYSGKVLMIVGDYHKASEKRSRTKKFFTVIENPRKRPYLIISLDNGNFFKMYPPESFSCEEGDRIVAYVYERSLIQKNQNTIEARDLVAVDVLEINKK